MGFQHHEAEPVEQPPFGGKERQFRALDIPGQREGAGVQAFGQRRDGDGGDRYSAFSQPGDMADMCLATLRKASLFRHRDSRRRQ